MKRDIIHNRSDFNFGLCSIVEETSLHLFLNYGLCSFECVKGYREVVGH